jgi:glutamine amidotransferase
MGWPESVAGLAETLPVVDLLRIEARVDSALLFALVLHRLRSGASAPDAIAAVVTDVAAVTTGRFNLLLTDGETIAATAYGDTLCYRADERHVLVASEPGDDGPGWVDVPDGSLVVAGRPGHRGPAAAGPAVTVTSLLEPGIPVHAATTPLLPPPPR